MNEPLGEREVLCISQFTLYGDARKGNRPSYVAAAPPGAPSRSTSASATASTRQRGVFGAHMEVELVNDGPVTLLLDSPPGCGRLSASSAASLPSRRRDQLPLWRAAAHPRGRTSSPPCPRIDAGDEQLGEPRGARAGSRPHLHRAHVRAGDRADEHGLELFGFVSFIRGDDGPGRLRGAPPTSPARRPRPTRTGGSTPTRRSSAAGAGSGGRPWT